VTAPAWHPRTFNTSLIVGATYRGVTSLPLWMTLGMGYVSTGIAYRFLRSGTRALVDNFAGMFPGMSEAERRKLALGTYRNYARDTIHFIRNLDASAEALRAQVVRLDTDALDSALAAGRGAIAVSPHFGNWELAGVILRRLTNHRLAVMAMREPGEGVTEMRVGIREKLGIETIEVRKGFDTALQIRARLERNEVVAMLVDRHLGKDRVPVTFFGRPAFFLRTPALMAHFTGAPLVPVFLYRESAKSRKFVMECGPAIAIARTGDRDANVASATQQVAAIVESQIRRRPDYWYQFYSFWAAQSHTE
jgi:KDO2-lipid IV(A) lauroyltransferase